MLVEREDLLGTVCHAGRDLGIERVPRALADEAHGVLHSTQQTLEGGVNGDVDDPHRQRDLLPLRAAERSPAVPALGEIGEEACHRRGKRRSRRPASLPPRTSPSGADAALGPSSAARARPGRRARAPTYRARAARGEAPTRTSRPDPYMTGVKMSGQRVAEDLGGDVRIGGAARVGEQAGVVGMRRRRRSTPSLSASRLAISVLCNPCSNGKPMPRSVARHSVATSSALPTCSEPCDASADTQRQYSPHAGTSARRWTDGIPCRAVADRDLPPTGEAGCRCES